MALITHWLNDRRAASAAIAGCVLLAALFVYRLTLVREVEMSDPAELALQAYQLGVTHPPGYPLHSLLGYPLTRLFDEPAVGTNLLSAICTALAVTTLAVIILQLTKSKPAALVVPLLLAFSPRVWEMAILTEVYNVNLLFFALAVLSFLIWLHSSRPRSLIAAAVVFGLSLGTYLANLLMLPAFLAAIAFRPGRWRNMLLFTGIVGVLGAVVHSYSLLRSHTLVPLGVESPPTTIPAALRYWAGEQYGIVTVRTVDFYLSRPWEHLVLFAEAFLYVGGLFAIVGLAALWKQARPVAVFTTLAFALNWGFFTFYGPPDYYWMVMPSYFIVAMWIAGAVLVLPRPTVTVPAAMAMLGLVSLILLATQYPPKRARAYSRHITDFGLWSLSTFPENAVVVSAWPRYTLLTYLQTTRGLRADVTLIEREAQPRYYAGLGLLEDYGDYVGAALATHAVIIDIDDPALAGRFRLAPVNSSWFEVKPAPP